MPLTLLVLGFLCQWLAWRVRLPAILFLLLAGIAMGPVSGMLEPDEVFGERRTRHSQARHRQGRVAIQGRRAGAGAAKPRGGPCRRGCAAFRRCGRRADGVRPSGGYGTSP